MGWFKSEPLELEFGQPVHVLVARAYEAGAIKRDGSTFGGVKYHFSGPHGIEYRGELKWYDADIEKVAKLCEDVQQDFNERIAAMDKARAYARDQLAVPPLFASASARSTPPSSDD